MMIRARLSFSQSTGRRTARRRVFGAVLAGFATAAVTLVGGEAHAITALTSDCNAGFTDTYNPGDAVCVTGEMDIVPPGKICAEGYVIVTPFGNANPFLDVTAGGPNYVMGCLGAGSFIDEYVWLPPLMPGQYEIVIDQYPFDDTSPGFGPEDYRTGVPFTVTNAPIVFSVDPAMIKKAAEEGLKFAEGVEHLAQFLILVHLLEMGLDFAEAFESAGAGLAGFLIGLACEIAHRPCPTSYNGVVLSIGVKILEGISESLKLHYETIIADPPDPKFEIVVGPDMKDVLGIGGPFTPLADDPGVNPFFGMSQRMAVQGSAYGAFLPTLEKMEGAQIAGSNLGLMLQSEKMIAHTQMALDAGDAMLGQVDSLEQYLTGKGIHLDQGPDTAAIQAGLDQIKMNGFSQKDADTLRSFGNSDADIIALKDQLSTIKLPPAASAAELFKQVRGSYQSMKGALMDIQAQAEKVRQENTPYALRKGPKATVSGSMTGKVGQAVMLNATATHIDPKAMLTYEWDTDLDGNFNDGTGPNVAWKPVAPGHQIVNVRVTDPSGNFDIASAAVDVTISNSPPVITKLTPGDSAPFADVNEKIAFHVDATDKDGDALTITWKVDGSMAGTGADLDFTMPDDNAHTVEVTVADTDPYSPDASATTVVRAAKWKGSVGTGSGGGGGSSSGTDTGPGSGSGGSGANGATSNGSGASGCGCSSPGSDAPIGSFGVAAAIAALAMARRRKR